MPRKLLQWIGVAFVLALVAAAVGGLLVLKDRIRVVIQPDTAPSGPDPLALLRDDVQSLQRELGELRAALSGNFERLGTALEERATARHADLQVLLHELAAHSRDDESTRGTLARLQQQLDAVMQALSAMSKDGNQAAQVAVAASPAAAGSTPGDQPIAPALPDAGIAGAPDVPAVVAPAKPAAFLSFSVPATKFHFDQSQTYVLIGDLCRVGFDAKSTLHDFTGVTGKVAGHFTANFADPQGAWEGEITCDAGALTTGVDGRDSNMWEYLDTAHHAQIRFQIRKFEPGQVDVADKKAQGTVHGQMTIRGKTRDVQMAVTIAVDASQRVQIEGQMPLKLSDYEVPVPSQLGGTITMQDEVKVWIALRARVQVGGSK